MMKIFFFLLLLTLVSYAQDGMFKTYYKNGQVESEINYVNRVRDGAAKFYYENGNLKQELTYVNGKVDGLVKEYYENGKLKQTYNIQDGKKDGPVSLYKEDGTYITDIFFEKGKRVKEEAPEGEEIATSEDSQNTSPPKTNVTTQGTTQNKDVNTPGSAPAKDSSLETGKVLQKVEKTQIDTNKLTPPDLASDTLPGYITTADVMPEPNGGWVWLYKKLSYPREAREKKIEGTTNILAYINEKGIVEAARVLQGFNPLCDEAARVAVTYTRFRPALVKGHEVKLKMVIPVEFKLQ